MAKSESKDEAVDGAAIAARILSRMSPAVQERVVKALQSSNKAVAEKVESQLLSYSQNPLNSPALSQQPKVLPQGSKETLTRVVEDDELSTLTDLKSAQRRILQKLDQLYPEIDTKPAPRKINKNQA